MSDWIIISPLLITVVLAIFLRNVLKALVTGIILGALLVCYRNDIPFHFLGLDQIVLKYLPEIFFNFDHLSILLFSFFISAMIYIGLKNGSLLLMMNKFSQLATSRKKTMLTSYLMGLLIFFDDYTNSLLVGGTMKKLFDRHHISREKLAYIIDSTAAPVASISFISTWIGFELGEIKKAIPLLPEGIPIQKNAYDIFLNTLPYSFYPILTLLFVFFIIVTDQDFGPMIKYEIAAKNKKNKESFPTLDQQTTHSYNRAVLAILPILSFVFLTFLGMYHTGKNEVIEAKANLSQFEKLSFYLGNSNANKAILFSAIFSFLLSILLHFIFTKSLKQVPQWTLESVQKIGSTMTILILAWILNLVLADLELSKYLSTLLTEIKFPPTLFPAAVFITAALIAFSTGSSWSAMGILYGLVIPLAATFSTNVSGVFSEEIFFASIAAVLSGAVWGDHCSPISDTTIMSSLAAECNHMNHVKSQFPYALLLGIVSALLGIIPSSYGLGTFFSFTVSSGVIILIFKLLNNYATNNNRQ